MSEQAGIATGRMQRLRILRKGRAGAYVDGGADGEVLVLARDLPETAAVGDELELFVFPDSDGRLLGTTQVPRIQVGQVAALRVVAVTAVGAFLDWGLPKDLLLPHGEQLTPVQPGKPVLVIAFRDRQGRVAASARLNDFLRDESEGLEVGDPVSLVVAERTDLGQKVVVNDRFWGLVYRDRIFGRLFRGERRTGYVARVREDGRLDISLEPLGAARLDPIGERILARLRAEGGRLPLGDKSDPDMIRATFGISKNAFRQAIGGLYRQRRILLSAEEIRLVE